MATEPHDVRAITVRQPWASLIACGAKTIETGWRLVVADQERSGPTPAQVEQMAKGMAAQVWEDLWPNLLGNEADRFRRYARLALDAIAAGEVPGVFVAEGEEWSVRWARGRREQARSEGIARTWAAEVAGSVERRAVGPWVPADEEASDG